MNVAIVQGKLYVAGIVAKLKNELSANVLFNVSANRIPEFCPDLWVHEADRDQAIALIQEFQSRITSGTPWTCTSCGEEIEGQFDACWSCGTGRADK